jgi:hypothetical protein
MLPHHVVARHGANGPELLNVTLKPGEEALPVFSFEGAASGFLLSSGLGREWYPRESSPGELVSLLLGLYAATERMLLDPLPGVLAGEDGPADAIHWERFVNRFLGKSASVRMLPGSLALATAPPAMDALSFGLQRASS